MSDAVPEEPLPSDSTASGLRIGHTERQAAVDALKHHHEAGRIDSQEYEERSVTARNARSRPELDALFTDLPLPHSGAASTVSGETRATLTPGAPEPVAVSTPAPGKHGVLRIPEPWATTFVSAAPILAVILFFVTGSWLWFLAIPLVALVVYGPDGRQDTGPEAVRRRERDKGRNRGRDA